MFCSPRLFPSETHTSKLAAAQILQMEWHANVNEPIPSHYFNPPEHPICWPNPLYWTGNEIAIIIRFIITLDLVQEKVKEEKVEKLRINWHRKGCQVVIFRSNLSEYDIGLSQGWTDGQKDPPPVPSCPPLSL